MYNQKNYPQYNKDGYRTIKGGGQNSPQKKSPKKKSPKSKATKYIVSELGQELNDINTKLIKKKEKARDKEINVFDIFAKK